MYVDKSTLRVKFLKRRKKLYSKEIKFPFKKIFSLIKKNFPRKKVSISAYYPVNFEVNILDFLYQAIKINFKVGLPIIKKGNKMIFKYWNPKEPLYLNKFGILEPIKSSAKFNPDVILVPLLVFDQNLNRVGYGRGYYDRALKVLSHNKKILTIGIAFSFQEHSFIPANHLDYKLDCILTDKNLICDENNENFIFR